ncbi:MAG: transporter [Caulobacteraceae bacterium]|nr:transporter [Caulobacteraceae bacterium]
MRLLILTPAPDEPRYARISTQWMDRLAAPLAGAGLEVVSRPWTEPGDLSDVEAVSPLLTWGYHKRPDDWSRLLDQLAATAPRVINPAEDLAWNTRKTYLARIEAAGAPVVATLFAERLTPALIEEAHARFGETIIAKPQVSGGSFETVRLTPGADLSGAPRGPVMLQPFLPAVAEEGELSLLYFGGRFSHAVGKVAQAGDFRVQFQYGGTYGALTPPPEALAAAEVVLAAAARPLTYARIDLIRDTEGVLRLMELEAIEPDLYLDLAPDGGAAFAQAVAAAMG